MPPAQDTVNTPSSSESKFSSFLPFRSEQSSAKAPSMPTSSSTVNTASMGGCTSVSSDRIARIMATAMQLSPPSDVLSAQIHSPSVIRSSPSRVMSLVQSSVLAHTMSMCPCRMIGSALSWPGDAGFQITTLLHGSCRYFSPSSLAKSTHRSLMIFVLPLPWGTEHSFSKYANTFSGFKPFKTAILILLSHAAAVSAPPIQYSISACRPQASPYVPTAHAFAWAVYAAHIIRSRPGPYRPRCWALPRRPPRWEARG